MSRAQETVENSSLPPAAVSPYALGPFSAALWAEILMAAKGYVP
jgi:hypothetical protein